MNDHEERHNFCYNQYELKIYSEIGVWVSWEKTGVCRGVYIKQLNTGISHN